MKLRVCPDCAEKLNYKSLKKEENPVESKPEPEKIEKESLQVDEPSVSISLGEKKWAEEIQILKSMGFGNDTIYFGPRCVALLEKYKGELAMVINELLQN